MLMIHLTLFHGKNAVNNPSYVYNVWYPMDIARVYSIGYHLQTYQKPLNR